MSKRPKVKGRTLSFAEAYEIAEELYELKPELFGDKPRNVKISSSDHERIRQRENAITPPAKRAASAPKIAARHGVFVSKSGVHTWRSRITALARRYIRRFGPISNASAFIKKLRDKGLLKTRNAAGKSFELNDITVRRVLRRLTYGGAQDMRGHAKS